MPRQREFDPGAALQTAITLFWEKGYHDASVDEFVKRSGVAKYGVYGTFGAKRQLFKMALSQYAEDRQRDIQIPIRKPDASLPEVRAFFAAVPRLTTQKAHPRGCLMCNTGIELGSQDAEMRDLVAGFFADIANALEDCLARAVENGELAPKVEIGRLARFLATEFRTALMLARSGHTARDIEDHLALALTVLR